ncbi:hypothetical protein DDB_G0285799 [Dictyostelium discoideum AX4]|uniref:FNIP repeat-containing protein n=1 Tax=Dictyostelium discoideum TaxID=44689 RepID=Q54MQ1_DICDI|nr:hypothetical protein DDB_G0285799 [Dictyostelium discoideum AX4]EAL64521.1 hypothetical protein DDB_G0285799 [Dictyostelium discoideum AX4]|eukprot:XP_638026.1 hypothetical protein DDB_G0285799 [Dictyostelium discoideum AX4]
MELILYNNNNNNKNKKKNYNDKLFFKIWKNKIIRNEIIHHLKIYNIHSIKLNPFNGKKEFEEYKYNSYLLYLDLIVFENENLEIGTIPKDSCIKELTIRQFFNCKNELIIKENSLPKSIKSLDISRCNFNQNNLNNKIFGQSITHLYLGTGFNKSLGGNWLPSNLQHLEIHSMMFNQDIKIGQLPESLTILRLNHYYDGLIETGSIPPKVINLHYKFDSNYNKSSFDQHCFIPKYMTSLEFDYEFNQPIIVGTIPKNITSIKFGNQFNSEIKENSLPKLVSSITFGHGYSQPINNINILPPNLTKLEFGYHFDQPIDSNNFPSSITSLKFGENFNRDLNESFFKKLYHLKVLEVGLYFKKIISPNSLPNSLKQLSLGDRYNHKLTINTLPSSLEILKLGRYYNHSIEAGVLPPNLKSLYLDGNSHILDLTPSGCLPNNLQYIYFKHSPPILCPTTTPSSLKSIILTSTLELNKFKEFIDNPFFFKYLK